MDETSVQPDPGIPDEKPADGKSRDDETVESLRKRLKRLEYAQRLARMGTWQWDVETGKFEWSDGMYRIFGQDPSQFTPRIDSVTALFHAEGRVLFDQLVVRHAEDPEACAFEARIVRNGDEVGYIRSISEGQHDDSGKLVRISGIALDVTEQRRAEEKVQEYHANLKAMIENTDDYALISDRNGKPILWNSAYARVMKEALGIEMKPGLQPHTFLEDEKARAWWDNLHRRVLGGEQFREEYAHPFSDGVVRYFEISFSPIREGGEVIGFSEFTRDITDRKRLEEQLRHSEKMQAVGQLAGGVAHDFNNQLAGVLGYADLLREEAGDNPELLHYAESIILSAKRAADLTDQLLAFSRKGKYLSVSVDMHRIVGEVISLLKHSIDKRIRIVQELRAGIASVRGDPTQLQNAILNLALNARDAMPDGGQLIFSTALVELDASDGGDSTLPVSSGTHLRLWVTDTGSGIPDELQRRIFEPFFSTKPQGKGTGMGLAAVYGTVRSHRGVIKVRSKVGQGTTFEICLPLETTGPGKIEESIAEVSETKGAAHVLLVDDERVVCDVGARMLEKLGYKVSVCRNGRDAIAFYRGNWRSITLVILDMVMPHTGGRDTFTAMREINPDAIILVASGYSMDAEAQGLLDQGASGFIQKPFGKTALSKKIAEVLQGA